MKNSILFTSLFIGLLGYSQTLPFTFSDANQLMTGDGCTTSLTTDNGDDVMQIVGGGQNFDNAQIVFSQNIDLSDSANNTITFRIKPLAPTTSGSHLLKFEDAVSGDAFVEVAFTTTGTEWQDVTLDFDDSVGDNPGVYSKMVIFTDFNTMEAGTYLIDDIAGGLTGEPQEVFDIQSPTPTTPDSEVLSIYGDTGGFTNVWEPDYNFGVADFIDTDASDNGVNEAIEVDFSIAGFGQGTDSGTVTDVSTYEFLHFDYWADPNATQIRMILIEEDGAVQEYIYELSDIGQEPIVFEEWTSVDVPLTHYSDLGFDTDKFFQYKLGTESDLLSEIVYFDNIYFSTTEGTFGVNDFQVSDLKIYPNPSDTVWNIKSTKEVTKVQLFDILGKRIMTVNPNTLNLELDASGLNTGLYFAKVTTATGSKTIRLLKK